MKVNHQITVTLDSGHTIENKADFAQCVVLSGSINEAIIPSNMDNMNQYTAFIGDGLFGNTRNIDRLIRGWEEDLEMQFIDGVDGLSCAEPTNIHRVQDITTNLLTKDGVTNETKLAAILRVVDTMDVQTILLLAGKIEQKLALEKKLAVIDDDFPLVPPVSKATPFVDTTQMVPAKEPTLSVQDEMDKAEARLAPINNAHSALVARKPMPGFNSNQ